MPSLNKASLLTYFPFVQPPPQTKEQCLTYVEDFITENIPQFFNPEEELKKHTEKAALQAGIISKKYGLRPEVTLEVMKLAFYDFVILCGKHTSYFAIVSFCFYISSRWWLRPPQMIVRR